MERIARMYEKWHIDLPLCNQLQLEELGVPATNILQSGICTYDNASDFFSARILKEGFGTIYTGIALKQIPIPWLLRNYSHVNKYFLS